MNLIDIAINGFKPMPQELNAFSGVAKNSRAHMQLTPGATIQQVELISNITDATKITKVEVVLNGASIVDVTGADLVFLTNYTKRSRGEGRYAINFFNPEAATINSHRLGELVTLPSDQITVYVTFGDTGETVPTLRARALVTPSQPVRYFVPKLFSLNIDPASTGENVFQWQQRSVSNFIKRLHFQAEHLTKMRVIRDDLRIFEASRDDNNADLSEGGDNAPQANCFHFDPGHIGYQLEGLFSTVARKSLEFRYDMAQVQPVRVLVETVEQVTASPAA